LFLISSQEENMDHLSKLDLRALIEKTVPPHISLYMPTYRAGSEVQQNPIRFKNLLTQAEDGLFEYGLRRPDAKAILEQAQDQLLLDEGFWQQQEDGLALFISPDLFQYYRLPISFNENVMIGKQFQVKPLFQLFQDEVHFYILALSQNEVRLLEGTRYQVQEVNLEQMPSSLAEALKWDDPERQTQSHTTSGSQLGGNRGGPEMTFHGHGVGKDDEKTNILLYFRKIDKGLHDFLATENAPLILAGVEYVFPIYQEANTYKHLLEQGIPGNPEDLSGEVLHSRALELISTVVQKGQDETIALYNQQVGMHTGLASKNIVDIVQSAFAGRVEHLLTIDEAQVWGSFSPDTGEVIIHPDKTIRSEDLLNTASIYTFLNNGSVHLLRENEIPQGVSIEAVFRY
jgi:hypothetical protein